MPHLTRPGADLFYDPSETGDHWITLLNGHSRPSSDFRSLRLELEKINLRPLVLDVRGSAKTIEHQPFTGEQILDDVEHLWRFLGIKQTTLLGISMGGVLAQHLIERQPQMVTAAILVSTASCHGDFLPDREWGTSLVEIEEKLQRYVTPAFFARNKLLIHAMAKQVWKNAASGEFYGRTRQQKHALTDLVESLPNLKGRPQMPTCIIHGQQDAIITSLAIDGLRDRFPSAKIHLVPNIGHLLLAECPSLLFSLIVDFLSSPAQGGAQQASLTGRS